MRQRLPDRVIGIYLDNNLYRMLYVENGKRKSLWFGSKVEANRHRKIIEKKLSLSRGKTIREFAEEYMKESIRSGKTKPESAQERHTKLLLFLRDVIDNKPSQLNVQRAQAIYDKSTREPTTSTGRPLSAASHHAYLSMAKSFFKWMKAVNYIDRNPFEAIQPIGKANRGKPQLRIEEARKFVNTAMDLFMRENDLVALGSLLALMCGLRVSEVRTRRVRDLDDGGRVLWIETGKTRNAKRNPIVPTILRPHLLKACAGRRGDEFIFGENRAHPGVPLHRERFYKAVIRMCQRAGVPRVCPHSLRGLWATLAVEAGTATEAVASALGHGSFSMTARHYAQPGAIQNARTARVVETLNLEGGASSETAQPKTDIAELRAQLAQRITSPPPVV